MKISLAIDNPISYKHNLLSYERNPVTSNLTLLFPHFQKFFTLILHS